MPRAGFREPITTNPIYGRLILIIAQFEEDANIDQAYAGNEELQKWTQKSRNTLDKQLRFLHSQGYLRQYKTSGRKPPAYAELWPKGRRTCYSVNYEGIVLDFVNWFEKTAQTRQWDLAFGYEDQIKFMRSQAKNTYVKRFFQLVLEESVLMFTEVLAEAYIRIVDSTAGSFERELLNSAVEGGADEDFTNFLRFIDHLSWTDPGVSFFLRVVNDAQETIVGAYEILHGRLSK